MRDFDLHFAKKVFFSTKNCIDRSQYIKYVSSFLDHNLSIGIKTIPAGSNLTLTHTFLMYVAKGCISFVNHFICVEPRANCGIERAYLPEVFFDNQVLTRAQ